MFGVLKTRSLKSQQSRYYCYHFKDKIIKLKQSRLNNLSKSTQKIKYQSQAFWQQNSIISWAIQNPFEKTPNWSWCFRTRTVHQRVFWQDRGKDATLKNLSTWVSFSFLLICCPPPQLLCGNQILIHTLWHSLQFQLSCLLNHRLQFRETYLGVFHLTAFSSATRVQNFWDYSSALPWNLWKV